MVQLCNPPFHFYLARITYVWSGPALERSGWAASSGGGGAAVEGSSSLLLDSLEQLLLLFASSARW